ncbi:MAG: DNA polymerase III subunit beta [Gammaproteobacteria bacterium]|nr:DNA polymerase III subunit beta [Gammaproteobacteria bacterium]NIM74399.1 DNA polymerase III subunit beta [Gammaproteobacteria bacterium]NIO26170.1 DNA polymerase III subunit beta [Gammaproteobacteria bacterium]NIO66784.1 DNA polymerase III subunit beta [Gammaproteobacteria bacterium]NIP45518.1 DNA polymerase III subunit beta [Gammaproteobacteria bacterium]
MKLTMQRENLLKPLQAVQGVVERRQTLPILSNFLIAIDAERLSVTGTDMEIELVASIPLSDAEAGEVTVPARKLVDICRSLPADAEIRLEVEGDRAQLRSGRSRFTLTTLPAGDYPSSDSQVGELTLVVQEGALKRLIELTHFAMAHQDVRYYLNGLLLDIGDGLLRAVATDGHRLAIAEIPVSGADTARQVIVPRKGISELLRLLGSGEGEVRIELGSNAIRVTLPEVRLTSKLIDGKFPDYRRVVPTEEASDKRVVVDRELLRQALARAAILSNDKYRAIRLSLEPNRLRVMANNPEQEEAEDEVEVEYAGDSLEIGFNVSYLIDALSALPAEEAMLHLGDASSSCLITPKGEGDCQYVVMPMRL